MTTIVRVLIEGNKACNVKVIGTIDPASPQAVGVVVKPGSFTTMMIHGDQVVAVQETGEFLS